MLYHIVDRSAALRRCTDCCSCRTAGSRHEMGTADHILDSECGSLAHNTVVQYCLQDNHMGSSCHPTDLLQVPEY